MKEGTYLTRPGNDHVFVAVLGAGHDNILSIFLESTDMLVACIDTGACNFSNLPLINIIMSI